MITRSRGSGELRKRPLVTTFNWVAVGQVSRAPANLGVFDLGGRQKEKNPYGRQARLCDRQKDGGHPVVHVGLYSAEMENE